MFYKKNVLRNFAKSTGKHLCQSLSFNKVAGLPVFSCEFCEISKNTFFTEHAWWLLLNNSYFKTPTCGDSVNGDIRSERGGRNWTVEIPLENGRGLIILY